MRKNIGWIDRVARLSLGTAIITAGIVFQSWWGVVGLVPMLTGTIRWCPAYSLFKMNTCGNRACGNTNASA